ncbi:hypothetical protein [Xanthomonas sp. 3075]|uniref:hypothetical protein n=1 Tax=Xanthomonas sp. 3075 TaxID=3035315 RepID=UPI001611557D|nr:hypothetical protein [Xanthomonas sp. 3075]MBB4131485.1 hypothetical protein [Xanthomonas sp. 3075]
MLRKDIKGTLGLTLANEAISRVEAIVNEPPRAVNRSAPELSFQRLLHETPV